MGHGITDTDNLFTVREPAWHGLGTVLDDYPTIEEAKRIAHPWEPVTEPVYRKFPVITATGELTEEFRPVSGVHAVVRSDTDSTLSVLRDSWNPVQNQTMYDIAQALEDAGSADGKVPVRIETAGSIKGGARVWVLVRLEEPIKVPGDPRGETIPYFAIQNSHDGLGAFKGLAMMIRFVCQNTLKAGELEAKARGTEFVFKHTANVQERISQAQDSLRMWRESVSNYQTISEELVKARITESDREEFIERFHPLPSGLIVSERVERNVMDARAEMRSLFEGPTLEGISDTAHGLVQSAVEYHQHFRKTRGKSDIDRAENLFTRSILDTSEVIKVAVKMAREIAHV